MQWHVVTVTPRREFDAAHAIERLGREVYVPVRRSWRHRSRYSQERELLARPLLSGYVFVNDGPWGKVLQCRWVRGLLCAPRRGRQDPEPIKLREGEMDTLRARQASGEFTAWAGGHTGQPVEIKAGDRVRITTGLMAGYTDPVTIFEVNNSSVGVEMNTAKVWVPLEDVEKII